MAYALILSGTCFAAGLEAGASVDGYTPKHLTGPDKGTKDCPPCKYSAGPMIQIFVNSDSAENVAALATKLEAVVKANDKLHGVITVIDETRKPEVEKWATDWKLEKAALTLLSTSFKGTVSKAYNLGTAKNVVVVSNAKKVLQSFENMEATDFEKAAAALK
jgi:protocatechuate 3,4-dioxygenase, beta subunit